MQPIQLALSHDGGAVFAVQITNTSPAPLRVWSTTYSSGYEAVYFQVFPPGGQPILIKRKPEIWTVNVPASITIQPGAAHVEKLDLHDGTWDLSGPGIDPHIMVDIAAVLDIAAADDAAKHGIVTGRYESNRLPIRWGEVGREA